MSAFLGLLPIYAAALGDDPDEDVGGAREPLVWEPGGSCGNVEVTRDNAEVITTCNSNPKAGRWDVGLCENGFAPSITGVEIIPSDNRDDTPREGAFRSEIADVEVTAEVSNEGFKSLYVSFLTTEALLAAPAGFADSSVAHHDAPDLESLSTVRDLESRVLSTPGIEAVLAAMSAGSMVSSPMLGSDAVLAAMSAGGTATVGRAINNISCDPCPPKSGFRSGPGSGNVSTSITSSGVGPPAATPRLTTDDWRSVNSSETRSDVLWSARRGVRPPGSGPSCGVEYHLVNAADTLPFTAIAV